jgi:hypothetical protein
MCCQLYCCSAAAATSWCSIGNRLSQGHIACKLRRVAKHDYSLLGLLLTSHVVRLQPEVFQPEAKQVVAKTGPKEVSSC